MLRDFLKKHHPIRFNTLVLSGKLWTMLAYMNEQAEVRIKAAEGVTENMKASD